MNLNINSDLYTEFKPILMTFISNSFWYLSNTKIRKILQVKFFGELSSIVLLPRKTVEIAVALMRHLFHSVLVRDMRSRYKQTTCWGLYVFALLLPTKIWQEVFCTKCIVHFKNIMGFALNMFSWNLFLIFMTSLCLLSRQVYLPVYLLLVVCLCSSSLSISYHSADSPVNVFLTKWSQHWMIFLIQVSQRTSFTEAKDYSLWKWKTTWWSQYSQ